MTYNIKDIKAKLLTAKANKAKAKTVAKVEPKTKTKTGDYFKADFTDNKDFPKFINAAGYLKAGYNCFSDYYASLVRKHDGHIIIGWKNAEDWKALMRRKDIGFKYIGVHKATGNSTYRIKL